MTIVHVESLDVGLLNDFNTLVRRNDLDGTHF
jgi:hypothetical protein